MIFYILLSLIIYIIYCYLNKDIIINKDIIVPDIIGGIGNQMFIIASAYAYGKRNNKKLVLDGRDKITSYGGYRNNNNNTIFSNITKYNNIPKLTNINEDNYYKNIDGDVYLTDGYYQDYKYFNEYKEDIIDLFYPPYVILYDIDKLLDKYNMKNNYNICLHIRLKDKFTPNNHEGLYTNEEINIIKYKLSNLNGNKLIFSNDIQTCKHIFRDCNDINYINEKDYLELYLMSYCNYYIASPSTFNWWGIYLNKGKYEVYIPWKIVSKYRNEFYKKYNIYL